jgi:cell division protein FtsB
VASATKKRKNIELPVAQFIAILVLSIAIFLIIDFGRRAATGYRVRREEEKLRIQLEALVETQQIMLARRDYVKSDTYVEEVARKELKWSQPGETIVVVMATPIAPPQAALSAPSTSEPLRPETPVQAWLTLFFPDYETIDSAN